MPEITCPHCKNPTYDEDAVLCHFCGESLGRSSSGALGTIRGAGNKWIWITLAAVAGLSFLLLVLR